MQIVFCLFIKLAGCKHGDVYHDAAAIEGDNSSLFAWILLNIWVSLDSLWEKTMAVKTYVAALVAQLQPKVTQCGIISVFYVLTIKIATCINSSSQSAIISRPVLHTKW